MIRAFFSGASGMKAQQTSIDVIANNLSNSETTGYKSGRVGFDDLVYSSLKTMGASSGSAHLDVGNGTAVDSVAKDMSDGNAVYTGTETDYCLSGNGFFAVKDDSGNVYYTRDGSFTPVESNGALYLGDSSGRLVLDAKGNAIPVNGSGQAEAEPGVFAFADRDGLSSLGDNLYAQTAQSGNAVMTSGATVRQGYLECSNVDLAAQMTGLIMTQRAYQMNAQAVQTADNIEDMANQLK